MPITKGMELQCEPKEFTEQQGTINASKELQGKFSTTTTLFPNVHNNSTVKENAIEHETVDLNSHMQPVVNGSRNSLEDKDKGLINNSQSEGNNLQEINVHTDKNFY